jgi:iron complex outermembrane receptor protein
MGQLYNGGKINNKGIEFSANASLINNLLLNITYSYINMKNPVFATPKNHLFVSANYKINKVQLFASFQYINHLNTVSDGTAPHFETYTLANAKVSYTIGKYIQLFVSGENLLNEKYETLRYYPMPGITVFGGVNFKL